MNVRLEGMVAKDAGAPYKGGRTSSWIKMRAHLTDDFVVVGFTRPKGSRSGFGALQLADYVGGKLTYTGRAGSGFTEGLIRSTMKQLDSLRRPDPPFTGPVPKETGTTWVEPRLAAEVR